MSDNRCKQQKEAEFLQTDHFCLLCGEKITKLIGKGLFCSKKCGCRYGAINRDSTPIIASIKNNRRNFAGENNPNYGKIASADLRQKISTGIRNSDKYRNVLESSRFASHNHTELSKQKIKETLKETLQNTNGEIINEHKQSTEK